MPQPAPARSRRSNAPLRQWPAYSRIALPGVAFTRHASLDVGGDSRGMPTTGITRVGQDQAHPAFVATVKDLQ
jgi:hypothetical protein